LSKQLKQTVIPAMETVWDALKEEESVIFKYNTELNIITMTQIIVTYSSYGNISYQNVCSTLGLNRVGSTLCKKRKKIKGDFYKELYSLTLSQLPGLFNASNNTKFVNIYAIDGSYMTCRSHNPEQPEVGMLLSVMYDVKNSIPIDFVLLPNYNERTE